MEPDFVKEAVKMIAAGKKKGKFLVKVRRAFRRPLVGLCLLGETDFSVYAYTNDALGRRTSKNNEQYGYNARSELISATGNGSYAYQYDDIGNRQSSTEPDGTFAYAANALNQYTQLNRTIEQSEQSNNFLPAYDLDGNKNVVDVIRAAPDNDSVGHFEYAPFGAVTSAVGLRAMDNPFRFSSEYADDTLGLDYYNYRHYNSSQGIWITRDMLEENAGANIYKFTTINKFDLLGLKVFWSSRDLDSFPLGNHHFITFSYDCLSDAPLAIRYKLHPITCKTGKCPLYVLTIGLKRLPGNLIDVYEQRNYLGEFSGMDWGEEDSGLDSYFFEIMDK